MQPHNIAILFPGSHVSSIILNRFKPLMALFFNKHTKIRVSLIFLLKNLATCFLSRGKFGSNDVDLSIHFNLVSREY